MKPRHGWAARWLRGLAALLPMRRREWAEAMAAEVEEIESGWEAWRWCWRGIFSLLRVSFADTLRSEWERGVTMSRVFVAISVLVMGVLWIGTPVVRQGVSLVGESWSVGRHAPFYAAFNAAIDRDIKLVRRDQRWQTDPDALAYLALNENDLSTADSLMSRAVERDPRLGWGYAVLAKEQPRLRQTRGWIQKAREYDRNNALALLLAARETRLQNERQPGDRLITPEWEEQMREAFAAPKYNDYMRERLDLQRVVMKRYDVGSPTSLLAAVYRVRPMNDIQLYADKLILDGNRSGDLSKYRELIGFAERLYLGANTDTEQGLAKILLKRSVGILEAKVKIEGQEDEAERLAFQVAAIQRDAQTAIENRNGELLNRAASVVHLATLFSVFAVFMIGGALIAWVLARFRRTLVRAAMPMMMSGVVLLISSMVMIYVSYRPYEEMYAQFLSGGFVPPRLLTAFAAIVYEPFLLVRKTPSASQEVLFWQVILVAGTTALVAIAARHLPLWRKSHAG